MDSGSVISDPISAAHRVFAKQKSASMVSTKIAKFISNACYNSHNKIVQM